VSFPVGDFSDIGRKRVRVPAGIMRKLRRRGMKEDKKSLAGSLLECMDAKKPCDLFDDGAGERHHRAYGAGQESAKHEGTWALPDTPEKKAKLKKLLSKPLPVGHEDSEHPKFKETASAKIYGLLGDDGLFDDLLDAYKKHGPEHDARVYIKKKLKEFKIKL